MNNNRGNNRRRGRGNNRSQGGGQLNRIDSRARGNAPQLLEKYRKLAQDAALNGDRVQAEYYLQFADHYFRVIADSRSPRDDMRPRRDHERGQDSAGEDGEDDYRRRDDNFKQDPYSEESEPVESSAGASEYEPVENPFIRDSRHDRGDRERGRNDARRPRKPRPRDEEGVEAALESEGALDPAILPPAIGAGEAAAVDEAEAPKPRRRTRRPRSGGDEGGEVLEQVG